jgi:hypothetical protein
VIARLHLTQPHVIIVRVVKVMGGLVSMKVRLLIESFVATWVSAGEWLFTSVDAHVSLEVEIQRKLLAALLTLVRLLTSVDKHMSLKLRIV